MNVPAEIILAKLSIEFWTAADDVIQCVQTKVFCFPQLAAKRSSIEIAPQRPDSVNKREPGQIKPGGSEIPNLVFRRPAQEVNCGITDQQCIVGNGRRL